MDLGLAGKRALVLSSSRGLGRGIAEALAAEGAACRHDGAQRGQAEGRRRGDQRPRPGPRQLHRQPISRDRSTTCMPRPWRRWVGPIDILVANTGGPPAGTALTVQAGSLDAAIRGHGAAGLHAGRPRAARHAEVRVSAASWWWPRPASCSRSRTSSCRMRCSSSILGWAKTLASEVARDGVTVNLILPGRIETDRTVELDAANAERTGKTSQDQSRRPRQERRSRPTATATSRNSPTSPASWCRNGRATSPAPPSGSTVGRSGRSDRHPPPARRHGYFGSDVRPRAPGRPVGWDDRHAAGIRVRQA